MVAHAYTVAFQGVEARLVEVQCAIAAGPAGLQPRRPARQGGLRGEGAGARGDDRRWASRCRRSGSPSTSRPPTCPRKARTSTCRSRSRSSPRWTSCPATRWRRHVALGELSLDGSLIPVIGALPAALAAAEADCGLICPAGLRRRGRLGRGGAGDRAEVAARARQPLHRPRRARPGPARDRARCRRHQGPRRGQGPGEGQARAGDRRRRPPPPADGRSAGLRQVDARGAASPASCRRSSRPRRSRPR